MARKAIPPKQRREKHVIAKATEAEHEAVSDAAENHGQSKSEYLRYWIPELNGGVIRRRRPKTYG